MTALNLKTGEVTYPTFRDLPPVAPSRLPIYSYSLENGQFVFAAAPCERSSPRCFLHGNSILLVGGVSLNGETLSDIWSLDIPSQTWELLSPSSPRLNKMIATLGAAVFLYDEKLVYFGGLQSIFAVFSLQSREWQLVALAEQALLHHASFPLFFDQGTRLVSFGGIRFPVSLKPPPNGRNVRQRENVGFFDLAPLLDRAKKPAGSDLPAVLKRPLGEKRPFPRLVLAESDFRGESDLAEMRQLVGNLPWRDFLARIQHADRLFLFSLACPATPTTPRKSETFPREGIYTPPATTETVPRGLRSISSSPTHTRTPAGGFFGSSAGEEAGKPILSPRPTPGSSHSLHRFSRSTTALPTQSPRSDSRHQSHIPCFTLPEMPPPLRSFSPRDLRLQPMDEELWRRLEAPPAWREEEGEELEQLAREWREERSRRERLQAQVLSLEGRIAEGQKARAKLQAELEAPRAMFARSEYRECSLEELRAILERKRSELQVWCVCWER